MKITPEADGFGACISGLDLTRPLAEDTVNTLRQAWLDHQVIFFPDQNISIQDLERFSRYFGPFGEDPYVSPISGHPNVLEIRREADEKASPFGSSWHSDWSFQAAPPSATILHARVIPPYGGDTLFADGYRAFDALPQKDKDALSDCLAIHSARRPYSPQGFIAGGGPERSMNIQPDDDAYATQPHPVIRTHPETGRRALWVNPVYAISITGMATPRAEALLQRLCDHATSDRFVYRHRWQPDMLTMWDNRCVQHCARGGYDGHQRVMYRTVVAGDRPY